jgi:hypothetical protein
LSRHGPINAAGIEPNGYRMAGFASRQSQALVMKLHRAGPAKRRPGFNRQRTDRHASRGRGVDPPLCPIAKVGWFLYKFTTRLVQK